MTTLNFTKVGNDYECTFTLTGDAAIHIERSENAAIMLLQRASSSGNYALVEEWRKYYNNYTIDTELKASVYPKYMKLVCKAQPTTAYIVEG